MLAIKFTPYSALYGQSLFWLMHSILAPFHLVPDLKNLKCRYTIEQLPFRDLIVPLMIKIRESPLIVRLFLDILFISSQTVYLTMFLICSYLMSAESLVEFGNEYPDSLTYKVLNNAPILSNGGMLIITLMNMLDSENRLWKIYDNLDTLSIDFGYQARLAKLCMLITVPDTVLNIVETFKMLHYIRNSYLFNNHIRLYLDDGAFIALYISSYLALCLIGTTNIMIRYKPVLNLIYSSRCISEHLAHLNAQISTSSESVQKAVGRRSLAADVGQRMNTLGYKSYANGSRRLVLYSGRASQPVILAGNSSDKKPVDVKEAESDRKKADSSQDKQFTISNLYELERHLTQISNFLYDLDRVGPESVLTITAINFMPYFFLAYNLAFERHWPSCLMLASSCVARTLPLAVMLISGSILERECKRLVVKLESIYLEGKTQSLIYKQMASSHLSLARILKVLERVTLNCNDLMDVSTGTLKNCFIYLSTVILIVVQYDAIMYINLK